jgi:hypothetical protein
MARELHRWPSPWGPILKPCQFAVKGEPDGASQAIPWGPGPGPRQDSAAPH